MLHPVLLEILHHKVKAAAEEMAITLARTARSTYVKDAADFATALATPAGKFFAYPEAMGVSGFLDLDCGTAIGAIADLLPGDVIITNHPYTTGGLSTHMPDLQLIKPYFHDGAIIAFGWDFIHSADIGGGVPSSISPRFDELFQEGLQIPPLKLVKQGVLNDDFVKLYSANCRVPELNLGDIKAMLAALTVGERRVAEIVEQHSLAAFQQCQGDLVTYARAKALDVQRKIPDGRYSFWDYMDDDFVSKIPIRIRCAMTVEDGQIDLDFSGSDPQVMAAYNVPTGGLRHPWLTLKLMHLIGSYDKTVTLNYGLFENITVQVPKGTVLNPEFPAAVGVRHATAIRINDALVGAIASAMPALIPAPSGGTVVPTVLAEQNPITGTRNVMVMQSLVGGTGARRGADGVDGRDSGLANLYNTPLERTEADAAVVIESYALRADSGGAGQWRGGTGLEMSFRIMREGSAVLGRGLERFVFRPWGIAGGQPGARCKVLLNRGTAKERDLGKIDMVLAEQDDVVTILTAGGGGFGDPFAREIAAVQRDVRAGFVSAEAAERDYGVVIRDGMLDQQATDERRRSRAPRQPGFDFGPERDAWERVFDDPIMTELATRLLALPATIRAQTRRRIIEAVVPGIERVGRVEIQDLITDPAAQRARLQELIDDLPTP
jgi:N-methylhydantoinase B